MISQPRYFPSPEFIDRIKHSDIFVLMDQTNLDKRSFENRTLIRHESGKETWLTIPTGKGRINQVRITEGFINDHLNKIREYYGEKAESYSREFIRECEGEESYIQFMIKHYENIKKMFGLKTEILLASSILSHVLTGKDEIIQILKKTNATYYITGDNCLKYGVNDSFLKEIDVTLLLRNHSQLREEWIKKYSIDIRYSLIHSL